MDKLFFDKWLPVKYLIKSEICGLEISYGEDETLYHYIHLKNKNNKLEILNSGTNRDKPDLPKGIEKNKIPLVVVINGKGVIMKKINISEKEELNFSEIIKQNLPAINPEDFYIQLFKQNDSTAFVCLCRKELINEVIKELQQKKYDLAKILIGAPSIMGLQPLWDNFNYIQSTHHTIELTNGVVDSISGKTADKNENIKIDDLLISPTQILGFAGGLSYLMNKPVSQTEDLELIQIESEHLENNKFRFLMISLIAIAFLIAMTNVVFYTSYFDENRKLESELSIYQGKYEMINELLNDYGKKKILIENAGILSKNKLSEYVDKIAATIPEEVILTEMYFNPKIENDESEDSLVIFKNDQMVIKGNCNKSLLINEWVNVLKMQQFVKEVNLEKFAYSNEGILPNYEIRLITQ